MKRLFSKLAISATIILACASTISAERSFPSSESIEYFSTSVWITNICYRANSTPEVRMKVQAMDRENRRVAAKIKKLKPEIFGIFQRDLERHKKEIISLMGTDNGEYFAQQIIDTCIMPRLLIMESLARPVGKWIDSVEN